MQPSRRRWLAVFRLVFAVALLLTLAMTLWPRHPVHLGGLWSKLGDCTAFGLLTLVAIIAFPHVRLIRIGETMSGFAAMIEVGQGVLAIGRDGNIIDWLIETGVIATIVLLSAPPLPIRRGARPRDE